METPLNITALNDFIFCPASIYFHNLYSELDKTLYQSTNQTAGTNAHQNLDKRSYRSGEKALSGMEVYCERFSLIGKIDLYFPARKRLIERKRKVKQVYDGYIFQLYGQYFAMTEMGYPVASLCIHSIEDNRNYPIPLPQDDLVMAEKFEQLIEDINSFEISTFSQENAKKCQHCIYAPACDREVNDAI